jgi:hypothetical protein
LKVRILSLALEELAAAAGYYQGKEHGLGKRFLDEAERGGLIKAWVSVR